jgi:hypothetical protein
VREQERGVQSMDPIEELRRVVVQGFASVNERFDGLDAKLSGRIDGLEATMEGRFARVDEDLSS